MIKQTISQTLGRAGERWFQSVLPKEWIFQKPEEDIGIDGKIIIGTDKEIGGFEFGVQIKASKSWKIRNGIISVDGIKSDTILYWSSRLFPTLLVIYDDTTKIGYYRWVFNILDHSYDLSMPFTISPNKTTRIDVLADDIIDKISFQHIKTEVEKYYEEFISSLITFRKSLNLIPIINRLIEAQRGIFVGWATEPSDENIIRANILLYITCLQEVVKVLEDLQTIFKLEIGTNNYFERFKKFYLIQAANIIKDFDTRYKETNTVFLTNKEEFYRRTPYLLDFLFDFILILTDGTKKERGFSYFKKIDNDEQT